jgi:hypothetical protein
MRHENPPAAQPFEQLATCRTPEAALSKAVEVTSDEGHRSLLEALGLALYAKDWAAVPSIRDAAMLALDPALRDYVTYACAAAGLPGAAERVAAGLAAIAQDLAGWIYDESWKVAPPETPGDPDIVAEVEERLRAMSALCLGWSAVAAGRKADHLRSDKAADHAQHIGAMVHATAWHGVISRSWKQGFDKGKAHDARQRNIAEGAARGLDMEPKPVSATEAPVLDEKGIVVVAGVSAETTTGGKEAKAAVKSIIGRALPLVRADPGKLADVRAVLAAEYPYAVPTVDALLADVRPGDPVRLRPTVIVGDPGGGKTRLAWRLFDLLGVGYGTLDAATCADHAVTGCPRRWSSGYPSLPFMTVERLGIANPGMVVDELEKAGRSSAGSIHDPLLSLLEQGTARRWRDQFLDAEVDVSHLSWIFTANALEGIPGALRNRLRILRMPRPGREHVPALAALVLRDLLAERGVDPAWEPPLDGEEIAALVRAVGEDISIRTLRRYVEGLLDARNNTATRN